MKTQSVHTIVSKISYSLVLSVISFTPLSALDVSNNALSLNISCSQPLQTESMKRLLTTEGPSANRLPDKVKRGIYRYINKLKKFPAKELNNIILSNPHIRIIKDTAEHAYLMSSEGVQLDDLLIKSVVKPVTPVIGVVDSRYAVVGKKQTILSHNFISKSDDEKFYYFQAGINQPHILVERQANNDKEGKYSTKVYACTETML